MHSGLSLVAAAVAMAVAAPVGLIIADQGIADQPRANRRPVVKIVEQLEAKGYGPFTEISFDDGGWEVEVYKQGSPFELTVDPYTGQILSEHRDDAGNRPPQEALQLSKILHTLESKGYGTFHEISFERRYWEVETLRAGNKYELLVDPKSGDVINERLDD